MSASWDDDREGSGFGADEFQKNIGSIREGLSRTKGETGIVWVDKFTFMIVFDSIRPIIIIGVLSLISRRKYIAEGENGRTK